MIEETTTTTDVERILKYFEKIRMSEIMYCEDHDREFLKDEECPGCQSERSDHEIEESTAIRSKLDGKTLIMIQSHFDGQIHPTTSTVSCLTTMRFAPPSTVPSPNSTRY